MDEKGSTPTHKLREYVPGMKFPVVLLCCGSFSPVTNMHIKIFESAKHTLEALGNTVLGGYFSPVHTGYKKSSLVSGEARLHMLQIATQSSEWMMVDPWEAEQEEPSPCHAVAQHLETMLSNAKQTKACTPKIIFVCGEDLVHSMLDPSKWPPVNVHRLLRLATLAVHPRDGAGNASDSLRNEAGEAVNVIKIAADVEPVSSTLVRDCIRSKRPISHLVHAEVERYICSTGLYSS